MLVMHIYTVSREQALAHLVQAFQAEGSREYQWAKPKPSYYVGMNGMGVRWEDYDNPDKFNAIYSAPLSLVTAFTEEVSEVKECRDRTIVKYFLGPIGRREAGDRFLVLDWAGEMLATRRCFHNLAHAFVAGLDGFRWDIAAENKQGIDKFLRGYLDNTAAFDKEEGSRIARLTQSLKDARKICRDITKLCSEQAMRSNTIDLSVLQIVERCQLATRFLQDWKDAGVGTPFDPDPVVIARQPRKIVAAAK